MKNIGPTFIIGRHSFLLKSEQDAMINDYEKSTRKKKILIVVCLNIYLT